METLSGHDESSKPDAAGSDRRIARTVIVLAAILATGLSTLGSYSIWDDEVFIDESPFQTLNPVAAAWTVLRGQAHPGWAYYPILHLSFGVDVLLFRSDPFFSHLLNVLLHAANSLLVWMALRVMIRETLPWAGATRLAAATFGALLFAVHPLNVEPVAWVSGRKVLLGFLFAMAAFLSVACRKPRARASTGAVVCCALAVLSNALFLALPLLIGGWFVWTHRHRRLGALARALPFLAVVFVASSIRLLGDTTEAHSVRRIRDFGFLVAKIASFFNAQVRFLAHAFFPVDLLAVYSTDRFSFAAPAAWGGVALAAIAVVAIAACARARSPLRRFAGWGALWYVVALLPTFAHHLRLADRYFYFAGVGFAIAASGLAGATIERHFESRPRRALMTTIALVALATLLSLSVRQSLFWRSDLVLFRRAAQGAPSSAIARTNYGFALLELDRLDEAIPEFEAALRNDPRHVNALLDLATALASKGERDKAVALFSRALDIAPDVYRGHIGLASTLMELGRYAEAMRHFQEAVRLEPWRYEAHYGLATAALRMDQYETAREHYEETVSLKPDWAHGLSGLAQTLDRMGEKDKARELYEKALERSVASGDAALQKWIRSELSRIDSR